QHVTDRTNWRNMLKGEAAELDMHAEAKQLLDSCASGLDDIRARFGRHAVAQLNGLEPLALSYPVQTQPERFQSHDLDKEPVLAGTLLGIKGQNLMLDERVINVRKYTGYEIELSV